MWTAAVLHVHAVLSCCPCRGRLRRGSHLGPQLLRQLSCKVFGCLDSLGSSSSRPCGSLWLGLGGCRRLDISSQGPRACCSLLSTRPLCIRSLAGWCDCRLSLDSQINSPTTFRAPLQAGTHNGGSFKHLVLVRQADHALSFKFYPQQCATSAENFPAACTACQQEMPLNDAGQDNPECLTSLLASGPLAAAG